MTVSMIITLAIIVFMVVLIISDKLPLGAPALVACVLLVITRQTDIATAFKGFTDSNTIMIMGFMASTAAIHKTAFIHKLKGFLSKIATKGGVGGFIGIILACMLIENFITGTPGYILIIAIIATIPYNKNLPNSRILLPAAMSIPSKWLPSGGLVLIGIINALVASGGGEGTVSVAKYCMVMWVWSAIYIVYALLMYRLLPDYDISDRASEMKSEIKNDEFVPVLTNFQQNTVYVLYFAMLVVMMFLNKLGEFGRVLPLLIACILVAVGAMSFKEMLSEMFSPILIMAACGIGLAEGMSVSGLSDYAASSISGLFGAEPSLFVLCLVFGIATSLLATFTGSSIGSLYIFVPIGIALCMKLGLNPVAMGYVCVGVAWETYLLPIDGKPALVMGTGKYKLTQFWIYTVPLYILRMLYFTTAGVLVFG